MWLTSRPVHFAPGKEPRYPSNRKLDGPRTSSGWFWRKEKYLPSASPACTYSPYRLRCFCLLWNPEVHTVFAGAVWLSYIKGHRMVWSVKGLYFLCKCKTSVRSATFEGISLHCLKWFRHIARRQLLCSVLLGWGPPVVLAVAEDTRCVEAWVKMG